MTDFGPVTSELSRVTDGVSENMCKGLELSVAEQSKLITRLRGIIARFAEVENFQMLRLTSGSVVRRPPVLNVIQGGQR